HRGVTSGREKLPSAKYSVVTLSARRKAEKHFENPGEGPRKRIVWDDSTFAPPALRWTSRLGLVLRSLRQRAKEETPGSKNCKLPKANCKLLIRETISNQQ